MSKIRLDQALVQQGYAPTRQKAQAIIMSGQVFVSGKRIDKCGFAIPAEAEKTATMKITPISLPSSSGKGQT